MRYELTGAIAGVGNKNHVRVVGRCFYSGYIAVGKIASDVDPSVAIIIGAPYVAIRGSRIDEAVIGQGII